MVQDNLIEMMYWLLARFETISLILLVFTGGFSKDKWAGKYAPLPTQILLSRLKRRESQSHQVFLGFVWAMPGRQKSLPLCLRVFVVPGFYAFCDIFLRGNDGTSALLRHYPSLEQHMKKVTNHHKT